MPATANLMIDSEDRDENRYPSPFDFFISKPESLLNGFFNRIGTTEVVLTWNEPNIPIESPFSILVGSTVTTIQVPAGFYTVEALLKYIVAELNAAAIGTTFSISNPYGAPVSLTGTNAFSVVQTELSEALSLEPGVADINQLVNTPDLRNYRYIDFVSSQLTYNQDLKDASTATAVRDVLCRWYFSWDNPTLVDGYGYPILQGYQPFSQRRLFSPPKQIRWDSIQPVGQLSFQVYTPTGQLVQSAALTQPSGADVKYLPSDWLMTLQVSEN